MGFQQILIVLVATLTTVLWAFVAGAAAEPATGGRPALPAPPDLDQWTRVLEELQPPPREAGAVAVRSVQQEPALRGGFLRAARATPGWGEEALVVERGIQTLGEVARAAGRPDLLVCAPDACELRAPLLVNPGAGVVIEGSGEKPLRVRLHQDSGAFAINAGILYIDRATIFGWSSSAQAPAETDGERFRPFIAAFGASETTVLHSELHHLGFQGAKAYGLTLSSHPRLSTSAQPSGRIFASRFDQLYYGLYTYEARSVVVLGNVFSNSHRYGIDPHDASSQLLIARNEIYGTQGYGLVLSKSVHDSWILENTSRDNAKSGILVDAGSRQNKVVGNRLVDNRRDGIAILESHDNVIAFNQIEGSSGVGIRVRASAANVIANNTISGSGEYGLKGYGWSATRPMPIAKQQHSRPVTLTLFGNRFADNAKGACQFETVHEVIAYADAAGDLRPCGETVPRPGDAAVNQAWSAIPGELEALRLVLADP